MKKIITNKDKLPSKLRNYVAKRKTWVDKDNRYEHYIYMDTVDKDEEQSYPEKTILRYNGSSDTKNIPNTEAHDNMISSSKDIEIDLLTHNTDDIGWWEAYYIFLHNWPDSRKPDPKTGKYNFGDDLKNKHATGSIKLGFTSYELIASQIQLEKLKDLISDHENPNISKKDFKEKYGFVLDDELKGEDWFKEKLIENVNPYPEGYYVQGRDGLFIKDHVEGLKEDFNENPDPEHWRINGFQYYIIKDGKQIIVGGNSRGRGFLKSSMRKKGMYTTQIPEEYYDVLTKEDLEEFSAFLNRNTENRVVHTNIETLIMRLKNKILKGDNYYLTRRTKDAGRVPRYDHPPLKNFFKGYEKTISNNDIKSIKDTVKKYFEQERAKEVRRDENSIDCSDSGLKDETNSKIFNEKIMYEKEKLEEDLGRELKNLHTLNTTRGMIGKAIINHLVARRSKILKDFNENPNSKYSLEETLKKEMPHDVIAFVTFETGAKYEKFINGGGSGAPEKIESLKALSSRMVDGKLNIIPIDPRIKVGNAP